MFLIQHGWGNGGGGGKVRRTIAAGDAAGVIWSACNYASASLRAEMRRNGGAIQMLDPQLYVAYAPGKIKLLELRGYSWIAKTRDANGNRKALTAQLVEELVKEALTFQRNCPELTEVVAPACAISVGSGSQLSLLQAFASRAIAFWRRSGDGRPLFVSAPIEAALLDAPTQERMAVAGALARAAPAGVYLLVELDPALDPTTYTARLGAALGIVRRLSDRTRVRVGYSGLNGWVFRAAGAEATAAGWFQNRRFWSLRNWLERSGGARLERVALAAPFALLAPADLATIRDADIALFGRVVTGVGALAAALHASPARAGDAISLDAHAAQLFAVCSHLDGLVGRGFVADARRIVAEVKSASALRANVAKTALKIEGAPADGRPDEWRAALEGLAKRLGVQL